MLFKKTVLANLTFRWSAIQTLLERSVSDALILLDCCAGAASATFPNGHSITETISASSWDAIAPDPGRYSFTNALIEVLSEWRTRTFSAAMLHAEILARLKHPRPIMINGKHFEARSTPVHFMMTSNHKAPSIEFSPIIPESRLPPSPPCELPPPVLEAPDIQGEESTGEVKEVAGPTIDEPHVMISLALEDDQRLDLNAWEEWLANFPALAKHVKVQGVFRSHSTLLLLSLPVMVWDLLPEDPACSFVAFIRSNNLIREQSRATDAIVVDDAVTNYDVVDNVDDGAESDVESETETERDDTDSIFSGTTFSPNDNASIFGRDHPSPIRRRQSQSTIHSTISQDDLRARRSPIPHMARPLGMSSSVVGRPTPSRTQNLSQSTFHRLPASTSFGDEDDHDVETPRSAMERPRIHGQPRRGAFNSELDLPEGVNFSQQVVEYLDEYFSQEPRPSASVMNFLASNLGLKPKDVHVSVKPVPAERYSANTYPALLPLPPTSASHGK